MNLKNIPGRGKKLNRTGTILFATFAMLVIGGVVYMNYLTWFSSKEHKEEAEHHKAAGIAQLDAYRAPAGDDLPYAPKDETKPDIENGQKKDLPYEGGGKSSMSIHEKQRRIAADKAWQQYYEQQAAIEQKRIQSMEDGRNSLWKHNDGGGSRQKSGRQPYDPASDYAAMNAVGAYAGPDGAAAVARGPAPQPGWASGSDDKVAWANQRGRSDVNYVRSFRTGMITPYQVMQGYGIPINLKEGMVSGLPIGSTAVVSRDVPCAVPGGMSDKTCIPLGSEIDLTYNTSYKQGECRMQIAAERLRFPDNSSQSLENMPVGDAQGYAGIEGECDTHLGSRLLNAFLFAAIGGAFDLGQTALGAEQVNARPVEGVAQQEARAGMQISPTLTVTPRAGRIKVHKDILFEGPYKPMTAMGDGEE